MQDGSKSKTSFEDFSNEVFFEIFDYLDGCDIYDAFSNLNIRFTNLLNCPHHLLKFDLRTKSKSRYDYFWNEIILPNAHRIVSLSLVNITEFKLEPKYLFCRRSNIPNKKTEMEVLSVIKSLKLFPHLFSLTMEMVDDDTFSIEKIYQSIFNLSALKYSKVSLKSPIHYSYWMTDNHDYGCISSIEYLVLDHDCTFDELLQILLRTPRLCCLTCKAIKSPHCTPTNVPINLVDLKWICIENCNMDFDQFAMFFQRINANIQVLRLKTSDNDSYMNAKKWEQFISNFMPYLRSFYLQCTTIINDRSDKFKYFQIISSFTSPFWMDRQWILDLKLTVNDTKSATLAYSLHPYKKNSWHASRVHLSECKELTVESNCSADEYKSFISKNTRLISGMQINNLNISYPKIWYATLSELLYHLSDVHSLKLTSCLANTVQTENSNLTDKSSFIANNNRVRRVYLEQVSAVILFDFIFLKCWAVLEYLEISCVDDAYFEMMIRIILKNYSKYIPHLRTLRCFGKNITDKLIEQLHIVIDHQKLLSNYTIEQTNNMIYLQWE